MHLNPMLCQYQREKNNDFIKKILLNCSFWRNSIYKTHFLKHFQSFILEEKNIN